MNGQDLISEFSELFTPPTKGLPMHSLERFIHPPSPTGLGDAAIARCIYVARTDLLLGGGRVIPRGTILQPGQIDDPRGLVGARKVWAIDIEPLGFVLAVQAARPSELEANRTVPGQSTREAQLHKVYSPTRAKSDQDKATNARAHPRVYSSAATTHPGGLVADPDEAEQSEQPNTPYTPTRAEGPEAQPPEPVHAREAAPDAEGEKAKSGHPTREPLRGARYLRARDWLQAALAEGPRLTSELLDEADEALHSQRNIERAASQLGVESYQEGRAWWKRLPESDRQDTQLVQGYARAREETSE